ncbi:MAG: S8 family serine peptidase [Bacteroidales bacterium]|nr:S8 family serine peptidase [Bacteroidales bacterium]
MKNQITKFLLIVFSISLLNGLLTNSFAQSNSVYSIDSLDSKLINWYNMSPEIDKIQGVEVNRAYKELLSNKKSKKKIVVAIIDGGVDIDHIDLQGKIWVNKGEIPNNGIDDDNNGYIDDIHGWGFLGNSKGENIEEENVEQTRIYRDLNPIYRNIKSTDSLSESQKKEYNLYLQSEKSFLEGLSKYTKIKANLEAFEKDFKFVEEIIKNYLGRSTYTLDDLKSIRSVDGRIMKAREYLLNKYKQGFSYKELAKVKEYNNMFLEKHYNLNFFPRNIIADNPKDINDRNYGNNDVKGPRPDHGTPVSGIIAAIRNNDIGIDGIAENVELMILRAVPNGDERDKDIALAIRYAVNNGANIINMSFGKDFSPQKEFVDEAIKYAEANNVLMVHAAGNDGENIDVANNFPTNILNDGTTVNSWITVGANAKKLNKELCGRFSNYGQKSVDFFAPGVNMILLYPGNKYSQMNGTSFSGPVVTGVAALVWSYYPELTAIELKDVLLQSCTVYPKQKVYCPNLQGGKIVRTKFSALSKAGGIVNAYNALNLAEKVVNSKKQVSSSLIDLAKVVSE